MFSMKSLIVSSVAVVALTGCVTAPSPSEYRAPQPAKPVDVQRLWSGRWHEIARLPDRLHQVAQGAGQLAAQHQQREKPAAEWQENREENRPETNRFGSRGGAQGVGEATTNAVVSASILILIFNYIITELFFAK